MSAVGSEGSSHPSRLPAVAEAVIEVVDQIPAGRVLSYGDIAELLGTMGPRQVGQAMARYGALTSWWRVVMADGRVAPGHEERAREHFDSEGTPVLESGAGLRVDMTRARWSGPVVGPG